MALWILDGLTNLHKIFYWILCFEATPSVYFWTFLTLQWCWGLNFNYCPVWRDFKYVKTLNALMIIHCTEADRTWGCHSRVTATWLAEWPQLHLHVVPLAELLLTVAYVHTNAIWLSTVQQKSYHWIVWSFYSQWMVFLYFSH